MLLLVSDLVFGEETARSRKLRRNNSSSSNLMVIIIGINLSGNISSSSSSNFRRINRKRIKRSLRLKGP